MNRKSKPIPEPIAQLQLQLDQFRSTQPRRTKLPESLWQAAVELARQHGLYPVSHPLRLDYTGLKKVSLRQRCVTGFDSGLLGENAAYGRAPDL